ncbi:hypothetical protein I7I51_04054 [Histoplasma capsulatum]|uniref:Uncharacterized protein n=1 Tax=Ajellomyces capsulatus TaxID=5037 RepID=A0A8A1MCK0_AJECA|nr:hypothetical protein I7I51_04054 [Histoplasma capsulatum]
MVVSSLGTITSLQGSNKTLDIPPINDKRGNDVVCDSEIRQIGLKTHQENMKQEEDEMKLAIQATVTTPSSTEEPPEEPTIKEPSFKNHHDEIGH